MTLHIKKLTSSQRQMLSSAIGPGLWERILDKDALPQPVLELIIGKLRQRDLLP